MRVFFETQKLKEACLPDFAEGFKNEIHRYDGKSFKLSHKIKINIFGALYYTNSEPLRAKMT